MDPRRLARLQGVYYLATGIWPLLSMRTFEAVTGRKRDDWLVKTVGLLAIAAASVLLRRPSSGAEARDLGVATALAFGTASLWYGGTGRISRIYLGDAAAEAALVALWATSDRSGHTRADRTKEGR